MHCCPSFPPGFGLLRYSAASLTCKIKYRPSFRNFQAHCADREQRLCGSNHSAPSRVLPIAQLEESSRMSLIFECTSFTPVTLNSPITENCSHHLHRDRRCRLPRYLALPDVRDFPDSSSTSSSGFQYYLLNAG